MCTFGPSILTVSVLAQMIDIADITPPLFKTYLANNCWCIQQIFLKLGMNVYQGIIHEQELHFARMSIVLHLTTTCVLAVFLQKRYF